MPLRSRNLSWVIVLLSITIQNMCTLFFAHKAHKKYRFILMGNRDEFLNRPTQTAHFWEDKPSIFGGKDLQAGGTWMALSQNGRFATLTNFRDPHNLRKNAPSRGDLVVNFLEKEDAPLEYMESLRADAHLYNGYNLLTYTKGELAYFSNVEYGVKDLGKGIYAVSNHILDTPWPKVAQNKALFAEILAKNETFPIEAAFSLLKNTDTFPEEILPKTGVPPEWEQMLSALFVVSPTYSTRVSTLLLEDYEGHFYMQERAYQVENNEIIEWNRAEIQL